MSAERVRRRGFSLVEIVVAMTLTLAVFAITLPFVRAQTHALGESAGRLDADQIARFAQRTIDRDLRMAGAVPGQPLLVQAGPMAISFSANLLASDTLDPGAADVQAGAPLSLTSSWRVADAARLPRTTRNYPTANHADPDGGPSRYETISYFLHPDTISGRSDIYVLFRRVNARDSVPLVRGVHVPADSAFFSYWRPVAGTMTRLAASRLPLFWDSVAIDSIRVVAIRAGGHYRNRITGLERTRAVSARTVVPNATTRLAATCGAAPGNPSGVAVSKTPPPGSATNYFVTVTWSASADDNGGALDVTHYLVLTRPTADTAWRPVGTVSARQAGTYRFDHHLPALIGSVRYGVRAVDCGGAPSATVTHSSNLTLP